MPRYLLTFEKGEPVRWLNHLDILRTFERAIRRSGLPVAFSQGFNPRERLAFASALGTGITGEAEKAILELTASLDPADVQERLNAALPPGIRIHACEPIPDTGARDLLNACTRAEYRLLCRCPEGVTEQEVVAAVARFLGETEVPFAREREGKVRSINMRSLVESLACEAGSCREGQVVLRAVMVLAATGAARPAEVVQALSAFLPGLTLRRAHRVRLLGA